MRILVTNDDGIKHPNIKILVETLLKYFNKEDITVVAPAVEQSAVSHRIEIKREVNVTRIDDLVEGVETYMVDSTPSDCVIYSLYKLNKSFDLVISGVNDGVNLGMDIIYSGTVAAAMEARHQGIASIALSNTMYSIEGFKKYEELVFNFYFKNFEKLKHMTLNINIPEQLKGIKVCPQYKGMDAGDVQYFKAGYMTITPLENDFTDFSNIDNLNKLVK